MIGQNMLVHLGRSITIIVKQKCHNGRNRENGWKENETDSKPEIEIEIPKGAIAAVRAARVRVSKIVQFDIIWLID